MDQWLEPLLFYLEVGSRHHFDPIFNWICLKFCYDPCLIVILYVFLDILFFVLKKDKNSPSKKHLFFEKPKELFGRESS